ncbi:DUF1266 domain-containing protein [Streptomyces avicenniae]|uniref:DUF1266 domain-containing protein n=1 Tax=Streptomyces avicenniae TaxID=500153 RepID=UPI0006996EF5|nr:DUF1266 domain-containing protein [Streptomyces avicenniae]
MGTDGAAEDIPWQPPSAVEQRLYDAGSAGEWDTYLAVLAGTDIFLPTSRELSDAAGAFTPPFPYTPFHDPRFKGLSLPAFTRGALPPPTADRVFERVDLRHLSRALPRSIRWLALNPGTPAETFLPADARRWRRAAKAPVAEERLKTLWNGHRSGPLAHGMACGALLMVNNGAPWNQLGWQSGGYSEERALLRRWWGVGSRAEWQTMQRRLLRREVISPAWEFVLRIRQAMILEVGAVPEAAQWRETAERIILSRTAEVVDQTGRPPGFDLDADIALVQDLIGRVLRYEARFRADGLLDQGACVRSVISWDIGRASCMARWGLGARYSSVAETEAAVLRAGAVARQAYRSWADFATGYILGRCLHFDSEEFGDWYTEMREAHRILSTHQESPWLSVPWEQPAAERTER